MNINGKAYKTIWLKPNDNSVVQVINQLLLPFEFVINDLKTVDDVFDAIKNMIVRGAPLIGVTASFGMYLAVLQGSKKDNFDQYITDVAKKLASARPTAINLSYAINRQLEVIMNEKTYSNKLNQSLLEAQKIRDEEELYCKQIGEHGVSIIEEISKKKNGNTVNILTHCNAGWLACVDYGTATASIYMAHNKGIDVHVWVDETRPRNQGARLTAWELGQHGIKHTIIADNTGGYLMQQGMVDVVIVGSDRTSINGDVANKIGTYLKALAANDNNIPFYVALPSSSIDWNMQNGVAHTPIEQRSEDEIKYIEGYVNGKLTKVLLTPINSNAANYGFDVTPARLITGLITEKGICKPTMQNILSCFLDLK